MYVCCCASCEVTQLLLMILFSNNHHIPFEFKIINFKKNHIDKKTSVIIIRSEKITKQLLHNWVTWYNLCIILSIGVWWILLYVVEGTS